MEKKIIKIIKIIIILMFFCLLFICVNFKFKSEYLIDSPGTDYEKSNRNYISRIEIFDYNLFIDIPYERISEYYLKNIEIIHNDKMIGIIQINKSMGELECNKNKNLCNYVISEKSVSKILNDKKLYKIIRTRFFERDKNYFKFKIFISSKKNNQKEIFIVEDVRIRYKKWYDFEIPYF